MSELEKHGLPPLPWYVLGQRFSEATAWIVDRDPETGEQRVVATVFSSNDLGLHFVQRYFPGSGVHEVPSWKYVVRRFVAANPTVKYLSVDPDEGQRHLVKLDDVRSELERLADEED